MPWITVRAGVDYEWGPWIGRFSLRHVGTQKDNDWNVAGTPIINYPTFTVADLHGGYRFAEAHRVSLDVQNLFDKDYFEKKGFPLAGRSFLLRYHYEF